MKNKFIKFKLATTIIVVLLLFILLSFYVFFFLFCCCFHNYNNNNIKIDFFSFYFFLPSFLLLKRECVFSLSILFLIEIDVFLKLNINSIKKKEEER